MKSQRSIMLALALILAGFVGLRFIPMKGLVARGGLLEALQLLRMLGVETPDEFLVPVVLYVLLGAVTVVILVRLALLLRADKASGHRTMQDQPLGFVGRSSRALFDRGGLLLRLVIAGGCILVTVLGVRRAAPLDSSALRVVASAQPDESNLVAAHMTLLNNDYARYLRNTARLVREMNKSKPALFVVPVPWWAFEDTSADQRFLNESPNVLQYRLPLWLITNTPPPGQDVIVSDYRLVGSSLDESSRLGPWPTPLLQWSPFIRLRYWIADSVQTVMDVSLAAALKLQKTDFPARYSRGGQVYRIGALSIPVDEEGRSYAMYSYPYDMSAVVSANESKSGELRYVTPTGESDTLSGNAGRRITGKTVFVDVHDNGFPLSRYAFFPMECASITASILHNAVVRRADNVEALCIGGIILISVLLFRFSSYGIAVPCTLAAGVALAGLSISMARSAGIFLQAFYFPGTAILCVLIFTLVRLVYGAGRTRPV
jgi:hypothetical protein